MAENQPTKADLIRQAEHEQAEREVQLKAAKEKNKEDRQRLLDEGKRLRENLSAAKKQQRETMSELKKEEYRRQVKQAKREIRMWRQRMKIERAERRLVDMQEDDLEKDRRDTRRMKKDM